MCYFIFQLVCFYYFNEYRIFIVVLSLLFVWMLFENRIKVKYEIFGANFILCFIFILCSYGENPNDYFLKNGISGAGLYFISDNVGLKRGSNPSFKENKYILLEETSQNKIVVNCSFLFNKCNSFGSKNESVNVKFVNVCTWNSCDKYVYEFVGDKFSFDENYFLEKYNYEYSLFFRFLIFYIFLDFVFKLIYLRGANEC